MSSKELTFCSWVLVSERKIEEGNDISKTIPEEYLMTQLSFYKP